MQCACLCMYVGGEQGSGSARGTGPSSAGQTGKVLAVGVQSEGDQREAAGCGAED